MDKVRCSYALRTEIKQCFLNKQNIQVQKHKVEMGVVSLTIAPKNPLTEFLPPFPATLSSAGFRSWFSREMFPPGDTTNVSLNWDLRCYLAKLGSLYP